VVASPDNALALPGNRGLSSPANGAMIYLLDPGRIVMEFEITWMDK
jgi:hypothetical protein